MAASLFSRIDTELDASGVATTLNDVIGQLGNAQSLLDGLTAAPADAIADMTTALQAVSIPELDTVKSLLADLQGLRKRIPNDPTELTGPLGEGVSGLVQTLDADLLAPLSTAIDAIQAAAGLLPASSAAPQPT